jgi:hypothetical protein
VRGLVDGEPVVRNTYSNVRLAADGVQIGEACSAISADPGTPGLSLVFSPSTEKLPNSWTSSIRRSDESAAPILWPAQQNASFYHNS